MTDELLTRYKTIFTDTYNLLTEFAGCDVTQDVSLHRCMTVMRNKHDNDPFLQKMLFAVYEELQRQDKTTNEREV